MSNERHFSIAASRFLSVGKKSLCRSVSTDLAAHVLAVDLGLKPALLYDINCATSNQVQQYLSKLQANSFVSNSLITVEIDGNVLIVNPDLLIKHLMQFLPRGNAVVINVCHTLEKPEMTEQLSGDVRRMLHDLLSALQKHKHLPNPKQPLLLGEETDTWNLCTLFGIVLGFPCMYWFDQSKGFDNCLSMTPLMVFKVSVSLLAEPEGNACCLYSFSIPAVLYRETKEALENWSCGLKERFQQQTVLSDLVITQSNVTLSSVCL